VTGMFGTKSRRGNTWVRAYSVGWEKGNTTRVEKSNLKKSDRRQIPYTKEKGTIAVQPFCLDTDREMNGSVDYFLNRQLGNNSGNKKEEFQSTCAPGFIN